MNQSNILEKVLHENENFENLKFDKFNSGEVRQSVRVTKVQKEKVSSHLVSSDHQFCPILSHLMPLSQLTPGPQSTYIYRAPQRMSPRRNWELRLPNPQSTYI